MNVTLPLEQLLAPLLSLSKRNQKWIADHLYENIAQQQEIAQVMTKEELANEIKAALSEVKAIKQGKARALTMEELFDGL